MQFIGEINFEILQLVRVRFQFGDRQRVHHNDLKKNIIQHVQYK